MTIFSRLKDCFNFRIPYFGLIGIILFVSVGLSGCTKRDVTHLAERQPSFKLENFFRGKQSLLVSLKTGLVICADSLGSS